MEQTSGWHQALASPVVRCGANQTPLTAIGNQAVMCLADDRKGIPRAMVAGRVRDQVFTITIHSTLKNDPLLTKQALQSAMRLAAEQVSGNLF
jgi:hypothetical protein